MVKYGWATFQGPPAVLPGPPRKPGRRRGGTRVAQPDRPVTAVTARLLAGGASIRPRRRRAAAPPSASESQSESKSSPAGTRTAAQPAVAPCRCAGPRGGARRRPLDTAHGLWLVWALPRAEYGPTRNRASSGRCLRFEGGRKLRRRRCYSRCCALRIAAPMLRAEHGPTRSRGRRRRRAPARRPGEERTRRGEGEDARRTEDHHRRR